MRRERREDEKSYLAGESTASESGTGREGEDREEGERLSVAASEERGEVSMEEEELELLKSCVLREGEGEEEEEEEERRERMEVLEPEEEEEEEREAGEEEEAEGGRTGSSERGMGGLGSGRKKITTTLTLSLVLRRRATLQRCLQTCSLPPFSRPSATRAGSSSGLTTSQRPSEARMRKSSSSLRSK